jgi:hypothetical protein
LAIVLVEGGSQQARTDVPAAMISFSVSSGVGIRQVISSSQRLEYTRGLEDLVCSFLDVSRDS